MDRSELKREDRVNLKELTNGGGGPGKFLLCRIISSPRLACEDKIVVSVTDPEARSENDGKASQFLENYSSAAFNKAVKFDDILPVGMYLILKNHNPKTALWDNPCDVQLLSGKDVKTIMGKDFQWGRRDDEDNPYAFWDDKVEDAVFNNIGFEPSLPNPMFNKLRKCGNQFFGGNLYSDAIRFYDLAQQYSSTDPERSLIVSNKAAALLRFKCNNAALNAARLAAEMDPGNSKAIYRMGQALVALGEYDKAVGELENKLGTLPFLKERDALQGLVEKAKSRKNIPPTPSTEVYLELNKTVFSTPVLERESKTTFDSIKHLADELAEYVGPVEIKNCETKEKGRGLFAFEDISPGQVVLVSRALSFHHCDKSGKSTCELCEECRYLLTRPCLSSHLANIANKIALDPAVGASVYGLSAGEKMGWLSEDDPRNSQVDIDRIRGILKINQFVAKPRDRGCCGFWFMPSFINHSCCKSNCVRELYGDVIIVKAADKIPKGNELLWTYVPVIWEDPQNKAAEYFLKDYGFTCTCKLCCWEIQEKNSTIGLHHQKVLELLKNPDFAAYKTSEWLSEVDFLVRLWKDLELSMPDEICDAIECLNGHFDELKDNKAALKLSTLCVSARPHGMSKIFSMTMKHIWLIRLNMREEMAENLKALKEELLFWHGTVRGIAAYEHFQALSGIGLNSFDL